MSFLESFRNVEIVNETSKFSNMAYKEANIELPIKSLEGSVNRHAPLKTLSPKEIKTRNKPWLSTDILKMIKIRNKVFARKQRQPNNVNCKHL